LHGGPIGLVVNVDLEAVWVVSKGVVADELIFYHLTDFFEKSTVSSPEGTTSPVEGHDFVDIIKGCPVVNFVVVLRN
jgi:hypothetical protein